LLYANVEKKELPDNHGVLYAKEQYQGLYVLYSTQQFHQSDSSPGEFRAEAV
jgi:hypothetical protein